MTITNEFKVSAIQIAPVFLNTEKTIKKLTEFIIEASNNGAELVTWGETLIPGYPQWISPSGGAKFDDSVQKQLYSKYWQEAVKLNDKNMNKLKELAKELKIMMMGGVAEKQGGSNYCTLVAIGSNGEILGRHRKLKPTYEERLVWADGDGLGLKTYETPIGKVGGLNCWENWLPIPRAILHKQEEMVHVAIWPGSESLTKDITRFSAMEGRSYVISASGLLRAVDFSHLSKSEFPVKEIMESKEIWHNGGSIIVNPKGLSITQPLINKEGIIYSNVNKQMIIEERQNLDISGHYSRFDVYKNFFSE